MASTYEDPAQLRLWPASTAPHGAADQLPATVSSRRFHSATRCPSCGRRAVNAAEDARMRADTRVLWLHPDPTVPGTVREAYHCQQCQPRGPVADTECSRCLDGGPLLADQFAAEAAAGRLPAEVVAWLTARGWRADGPLICPNHHQGQSYRDTKPYRT